MIRRIALVLLVGVVLASCGNWSEARVAETERRGDIICRALDMYRSRTGKLPNELAELVPEYLKEIPLPTVGKKAWAYRQQGSYYDLEVEIRWSSEPLLQTRAPGHWSYDTK